MTMICSGCGKDIPVSGEVCPYCGQSKAADRAANREFNAFIWGGALLFGVAGYGFVGNIWGLLLGLAVGFVLGGVVGLVYALVAPRRTARPPTPKPVGAAPSTPSPAASAPAGADAATLLVQLKQLHEQGVLTDEEFAAKKAELLSRL